MCGSRVLVVRYPNSRIATDARASLSHGRRVEVCALHPDELVALVAEYPRSANKKNEGRAGAADLAKAALRSSGTAFAGVSSAVTGGSQLATAYREALAAAELAAELPERYALADEHWAFLTSQRLAPMVAASLTLDNPLARLSKYDQEHGADLVRTAAIWLSNNCDTARAAAALCVHHNTLRYRLRRATEVSGLDLDDPNSRALTILLTGVISTIASTTG